MKMRDKRGGVIGMFRKKVGGERMKKMFQFLYQKNNKYFMGYV